MHADMEVGTRATQEQLPRSNFSPSWASHRDVVNAGNAGAISGE